MSFREFDKSAVSLIGLFFLLTFAGCKSTVLSCGWSEEISVDGRSDDWSEIKTSYFKDQQAVIGIACDKQRLYLMLRSRDKNLARSAMRSGLTVWFDSTGKAKKKVALRFFDGIPNRLASGRSDRQRPEETAMRKRAGGEMNKGLIFIDKNESRMLPIASDGSAGPAAAFDTSFGFFVYEFSIPLAEQPIRNYGLGVRPGEKIAIGIEWGGRDNMKRSSKGDRPTGGMGGQMPGMGGGRGGGGGGRGMGGSMKPDRSRLQKHEIWFKTILPLSSETL